MTVFSQTLLHLRRASIKSEGVGAELSAHSHSFRSLHEFFRNISTEEERAGYRNFSQRGEVTSRRYAKMKAQGRTVAKQIVHEDRV